jgi:hypothetical protein
MVRRCRARRAFTPRDGRSLWGGRRKARRQGQVLTGTKGGSAHFWSPLSRITSRTRCTAPAALKRGGDKEFVGLDAEETEERYRFEPIKFLTPEKLFDARWAMTLLAEAFNRLRQEYTTDGKTATFEALKVFQDHVNSSSTLL